MNTQSSASTIFRKISNLEAEKTFKNSSSNLIRTFLGACFLAITVILCACEANEFQEKTQEGNKASVGYRFFYNQLVSESDDEHGPEHTSIETEILNLFSRCDSNSIFQIFSNNWPDTAIFEGLISQLHRFPNATSTLVIGNHSFDSLSILKEIWFKKAAQKCSNLQLVEPIWGSNPINKKEKKAKQNANFILYSGLKANGRDLGNYGLVNFGCSLDQIGPMQITEMIEIFGDSSIYSSLNEYGKAIINPSEKFEFEETHVYSNLFDHKVEFLSNQAFEDPFNNLLEKFEEALSTTHQPAKLRFAITSWDVCYLPFAKKLAQIQKTHELDLKIILKDSSSTFHRIASVFESIPDKSFRIFPAKDSISKFEFQSNFFLIDGPFSLVDDGLPKPEKLCFFLSSGLEQKATIDQNEMMLRVADASLFAQLEVYWNSLWDWSIDSIPANSKFGRTAKFCKN